jgi:hypothetical protein
LFKECDDQKNQRDDGAQSAESFEESTAHVCLPR